MDVEECTVETVEISRKLFESRLRNVRFASWDELLAAVAGKPTGKGYTALHGESETVFHLDPVRVFGWVAMVLISVCIWGLVGSSSSPPVAIVITMLYGMGLWFVLHLALAPRLAGVVWPNLPIVVGAIGACTLRWIQQASDCCNTVQTSAALVLILCVVPHTLAAVWWMRGLSQDPDRATLFVNIFIGFWAILTCLIIAVGIKDSAAYLVSQWALLLLGLGSVALAGRLFILPGTWGSAELISWVLNIGVLSVFITVHAILNVPFGGNMLQWSLYLMLPAVLGMLGAVFDRSFPVLLSACACITIVIRASVAVADIAPDNGKVVASLLTFGSLGMAIIALTQILQRSQWWAKMLTDSRLAMARAYGAVPATGRRTCPHDWNSTTEPPEL